MNTAQELAGMIALRCKNACQHGAVWRAACPGHDGDRDSLVITPERDRVLLRCHSQNCTPEGIVAAIGLGIRDLFVQAPNGHTRGKIVATYDYCDASGKLIFQVLRFTPKDFRQRRPDPERKGRWVWNIKGLSQVPYRLPQILQAIQAGAVVFVVEGEKDVHSLESIGLVATCNSGGAGKWTSEHAKFLQGARVVVLPDNDEAGRKHAEQVASSLRNIALSIKIVELPGLPSKGDVSDWLQSSGSQEQLEALVATAPEWEPPTSSHLFIKDSDQVERPLPLRRELPAAEPYPLGVLGDVLGRMAQRLIDVVQAPDSLCGQGVLAAAALAVQGHANVVLDGRRHLLSCYFVSVAESGERKSAVDTECLAPHRAYQKQLHSAYRQLLKDYQNENDAYQRSRDEALKKGKSRAEKEALLDALESPPVKPLEPLLIVQEPTYEGIFKLLQHGQPSVGLFADEGGRLVGGHALNQENALKTAAGLSELWDGKPISRVRAGDDTVMLYGRRMSMHLMIQPVVAPALLGNTLLAGQGLLSRCLVAWPTSTAGQRRYQAVNLRQDDAVRLYSQRIMDILCTPLPIADGTQNELEPRSLPLHREAQEAWITFHDHIESQLGDGQSLAPVRAFASKLPEHVLRLAGVLALTDDLQTPRIDIEHLTSAIHLAEFYLAEWLRLFGAATVDPDLVLAEKLLEWAREHPHVSLPMVYQRGPNTIRDVSTAKRIVGILEGHGWFRRVPGGMTVEGKFRRDVWEVVHE